MNNGKQYKLSGNIDRAIIKRYHGTAALGLHYGKTTYKADIKGLRANKDFCKIGAEVTSKFTIGFEVEKNNFTRSAFSRGAMVGEQVLFRGYETDCTCGVEAVSHILPLLPSSSWRTKIFGMMHDANKIIDDNFSPSDFSCGGHITIGVEGMTDTEIYKAVKPFLGLIYALYRKRLTNTNCRNNINGVWGFRHQNTECGVADNLPVHNGHDSKYCPVKLRGNGCIEFRLVSRFQSVKQMTDRYKIFYELLNFAINKPNARFSSFLKKVEPILNSMYNDSDKVAEVMKLAQSFRKYLVSNGLTIPQDVAPFVDANGRNADMNRAHRLTTLNQ